MKNNLLLPLIHKFQGLEGGILKGAALLTVGMVAARVLGILFTLILASVFIPAEFGAIKYAITLGSLVAIGSQPFGQHVLARFIGKYKKTPEHLQRVLSNALLILFFLILFSLLLATIILFLLGKFDIGVLTVFIGGTLFYTYWGVSSGFLAYGKLSVAYLGSNLVQLILVLLLIYFLKIYSPLLAVMIYGLSYFLPLALLQLYWPLPIQFRISFIQKKVINEILRFLMPIWISHAGYILNEAIPILVLEYFSGMADVGVYSLATTLAMIFIFVPTSISTLLMPKTSELKPAQYRRLLKRVLVLSSLFNGLLMIGFVVSIKWGVLVVFGESYLTGISVFIIRAAASIVFGVNTIITAVVVGSGRPGYETISRLMVLAVTAFSAWMLIPSYGPLGAAITACLGSLAGLIVYGIIALNITIGKPAPEAIMPRSSIVS